MPIIEPPRLSGLTDRILELTSTQAPWHRRLWRGGTMELAQEFLTDSIRPGAREIAIADRRKHLMNALRTDHGIADFGKRIETLAKDITTDSDETSHAWIALRHHLAEMNDTYLTNWADALDAPPSNRPVDAEGAARRITAHILGSGMHKNSLHRWLRDVQSRSTTITPGDFLRQADQRLKAPEKIFTFCVPVDKTPPFQVSRETAPGWMTARETADWKRRHAPEAKPARHQGSFLLEITARDVNAAADAARDVIAHLKTKFQLGSRNSIGILPTMWSMQRRTGFPTLATNRMINLASFDRLGRLQDLTTADYLANTLALVEPLQTAAPHIAVISGWSAIESLLVGPADIDDIVAARRFSLIIAASLMRAEFTWLAKTYTDENDDDDARALDACETNIERAKRFQVLAFARPNLALANVTDNLALQRVRPALQNPRREITNIVDILTREFTRLYRKRNMVVHGGQIHGANLHSISDTLTPLIGAGIDRIVNAELQFGVPPIELSAISEARVDYLRPTTSDSGGGLLDLLEHPVR
ncbi:integrase [Mycobacterium sherrisii]|uniref:integrase n=1 Tax=Mycobacterium sherrisii TaxID=243061 RepID=UPI002DDD1B77|nr:integrase [Mycobacterium sherrisii]MEC4765141.1 integrase [Mycobacterium sherrisii]